LKNLRISIDKSGFRLNTSNYDALMQIFREHGGAYGNGIEYAYSIVHKVPQSAHNPHVVKK
jgi:hypothetical protein